MSQSFSYLEQKISFYESKYMTKTLYIYIILSCYHIIRDNNKILFIVYVHVCLIRQGQVLTYT